MQDRQWLNETNDLMEFFKSLAVYKKVLSIGKSLFQDYARSRTKGQELLFTSIFKAFPLWCLIHKNVLLCSAEFAADPQQLLESHKNRKKKSATV